jgi:hypothetical protein
VVWFILLVMTTFVVEFRYGYVLVLCMLKPTHDGHYQVDSF